MCTTGSRPQAPVWAAQAREEIAQLGLQVAELDANALEQAKELLAAQQKEEHCLARLKDVQQLALTGGRESVSLLAQAESILCDGAELNCSCCDSEDEQQAQQACWH